MIQTQVKQLSDHEHQVQVTLPQSEYDRVYAEQTAKLGQQARLPGFRPGKTPKHVIQKQFGPKIHEDAVSELLQANYIEALESSGLVPAVQPEVNLPAVQPEDAFQFTLNVVTWPVVALNPLEDLSVEATEVVVEDADVNAVVERLMASQVTYEVEEQRVAEMNDQVTIDFVGFVDGEAFEGGDGEDHALVLGSGQFIPGFEEQLVGHQAGEHLQVTVTFPDPYQAAHLAGKEAVFETDVKSVAKSVKAENEDALAAMLNFDDAQALRDDAKARLVKEAEDATRGSQRDGVLDALLDAYEISLPARLLDEEIRATTERVKQSMQQQGVEMPADMLTDETFRTEARGRAEKNLKTSILLQAVRTHGDISVDDAAVDAEIEQMSKQYPEEQHDMFVSWIKSQEKEMASLRDRVLEQVCVAHVLGQAKLQNTQKPLSVWQKERDEANA